MNRSFLLAFRVRAWPASAKRKRQYSFRVLFRYTPGIPLGHLPGAMHMRKYWHQTIAVLLILSGVSTARADLPPLIPRAILFGNPEKASPQLSPDGKHLAYI